MFDFLLFWALPVVAYSGLAWWLLRRLWYPRPCPFWLWRIGSRVSLWLWWAEVRFGRPVARLERRFSIAFVDWVDSWLPLWLR